MLFKVMKNENIEGGGGEDEKEESLLPSSSALTEVEVFPEILLLFYQTACSYLPVDGDRHENVRC